MSKPKKLTQIETAELVGKLEMLRLLGHAWTDPNDSCEYLGKALDGTIVRLGRIDGSCWDRGFYEYLLKCPTPSKW